MDGRHPDCVPSIGAAMHKENMAPRAQLTMASG